MFGNNNIGRRIRTLADVIIWFNLISAIIGAYFTGWYLEDTLDTPYEFDTVLNADTTLYARYLWPDPSLTLRLPNALTTVKSKAFAGAHVVFVAIPKTVTSIADDAFDAGIVIIAPAGSYAETWANDHGFMVNNP